MPWRPARPPGGGRAGGLLRPRRRSRPDEADRPASGMDRSESSCSVRPTTGRSRDRIPEHCTVPYPRQPQMLTTSPPLASSAFIHSLTHPAARATSATSLTGRLPLTRTAKRGSRTRRPERGSGRGTAGPGHALCLWPLLSARSDPGPAVPAAAISIYWR